MSAFKANQCGRPCGKRLHDWFILRPFLLDNRPDAVEVFLPARLLITLGSGADSLVRR